MDAKNIILKSHFDQQNIYCKLYETDSPKAIVQIIHGMKEHQSRYADFAKTLNQAGFIVMTSDLRGHGENTDPTLYGYFGEKKPHQALLADQQTITAYLNEAYPTLKINLFAHSMGTIIARNLIQNNAASYERILLSGVPAYQWAAHLGLFVADIIGFFKSNRYVSPLLEHLTLHPFEKAIKDKKTANDWLSYNEENVKAYYNDPYCGIPFTVSAYKALFRLNINMHKKRRYRVLNPSLPILLLAGKEDPCTLGTKGLKSSMNVLIKAGYQNVHIRVYDRMRHEILNEEKKKEVIKDILSFLN